MYNMTVPYKYILFSLFFTLEEDKKLQMSLVFFMLSINVFDSFQLKKDPQRLP